MGIGRWIRHKLSFLWERTPHLGQTQSKIWGHANKAILSGLEIPKTIWIYWEIYPIKSPTVIICIEEIKRLNPHYDIHVISKDSVLGYLPNFPTTVFEFAPTASSDLIRLMLLEKYGGFYLDASTLLSESLDWAIKQQKEDQSEAILYYTDENTIDGQYPMVENSFIGAIKGSNFISHWRKVYEQCITSQSPEEYFKDNAVLDLSDFPLRIPYYLGYLAGQITMRSSKNYRLTLRRAEDELFLYSLGIRKKWGEMAMAEILLLNETPDPKPKAVKIIRYARRRLDIYIKKGMYKHGSWVGDLLP